MTLFHVSIIGNIVLLVLIAILTLDRMHFKSICKLRHNPIDTALKEIKDNIKGMRQSVKDDFQRIWEAIDKLK